MKTKGQLTVSDAAAALGVHRNAVSRWIASGKLAATREGRKVLVNAADLQAFRRRTCVECGKRYDAEDARQVYCGRSCKDAATNRRKAEGKPRKPLPRTRRHKPLAVAFNAVLRATH